MSKRWIGWGMLIFLALLLNVRAGPIAVYAAKEPVDIFADRNSPPSTEEIIAWFKTTPDYAMHMRGLRTTEARIKKQRTRQARYRSQWAELHAKVLEIRKRLKSE